MQKLDAVNIILRNLGENPLPGLDVQYPTLNLALPALEDARIEVLTEGWWFNTRECITLLPDLSGNITLPARTLVFYPDDPDIIYEGTRLISNTTGDVITDKPVTGRLVTDLDFEELPDTAQRVIAYTAAYNTYVVDNGVDTSAQTLQQTRNGFAITLASQHIRARKFSSKQKATVRRYRANLST